MGGNLGLGIVLVGVFICGFAFSWSIRHAFNLTVWFGVGWVASLLVLYLVDSAGISPISTDPLGSGGAVALGIGAIVAYYYHRRWQKEQLLKRQREAEARARRRAKGIPEPSFLGNVGRAVRKMRSSDG